MDSANHTQEGKRERGEATGVDSVKEVRVFLELFALSAVKGDPQEVSRKEVKMVLTFKQAQGTRIES